MQIQRDTGFVRALWPLRLAATLVSMMVGASIFATLSVSVGYCGPLARLACSLGFGAVGICCAGGCKPHANERRNVRRYRGDPGSALGHCGGQAPAHRQPAIVLALTGWIAELATLRTLAAAGPYLAACAAAWLFACGDVALADAPLTFRWL